MVKWRVWIVLLFVVMWMWWNLVCDWLVLILMVLCFVGSCCGEFIVVVRSMLL